MNILIKKIDPNNPNNTIKDMLYDIEDISYLSTGLILFYPHDISKSPYIFNLQRDIISFSAINYGYVTIAEQDKKIKKLTELIEK